MKRLVVVLSSLLVLPAFAEVAPSFYYDEPEMTDVELTDIELDEVAPETEAATPAPAVKKKPSVAAARQAMTGRTTKTRTTTARTTATRSGVAARVPTTRANTTTSRSISGRTTTASTPVRSNVVSARRGNDNIVNDFRSGTKARAGVVNTTTKLYNPNNVTVQQRNGATSISARSNNMRAAVVSTNTTTAEDVIDTTSELETMKSLTEYCQAQYAACMDNYCNVLDDNQGRCSCSKNLSNYEKTEAALQSATEALQDVARSIQYIGLTSEQITTLFDETEAELTMKNQKDTSAIRSDLDKVKRMIVDVKTGTSTATVENGLNFDLSGLLDVSISSTGFDLSSFMNTSSNTSSISNQRGESLFKTATARCKASVLNACTAQGVDAAMVTNSYDLEIDKSCLAYERALTDSNKQMSQTVANAKEVLKKARLMVAQNKNAYDLRGCVSALESCMQDDYVCGSDYENCLDPTGQYIVNGNVVVGSMPGNNTEGTEISSHYSNEGLFATWKDGEKSPWYPNPNEESKYVTLVKYIDNTVSAAAAKNSSDKMSAYLQYKIGWHDSKANKDYGMCMNVLNQCQKYTYETKGNKTTYNAENDVIKHFLQRALVQIKAKQDELLASYAEDCISDVSSCLSTNNYDENLPQSTKSRAAINSCYAQIKTCMSINGNIYGSVNPTAMQTWVTGTYSAIESVSTQADLDAVCANITDQDTCEAAKVYVVSCTGNTSTLQANACKYNTTPGSCSRDTDISIPESCQ